MPLHLHWFKLSWVWVFFEFLKLDSWVICYLIEFLVQKSMSMMFMSGVFDWMHVYVFIYMNPNCGLYLISCIFSNWDWWSFYMLNKDDFLAYLSKSTWIWDLSINNDLRKSFDKMMHVLMGFDGIDY